MAVEGKPQDAAVAAQSKRPSSRAPEGGASPGGAPGWVAPVYLGGLALLYIGERVIVSQDKLKMVVSLLGAALLLVGTVVRFLPNFRGVGERASIERLLGWLSLVGVLGVLVYFASTSAGMDLLGISGMAAKDRDRVETLLFIAWVTLVAVSVVPILFAEAALLPMRNAVHLEARRVRAAAASGVALALAGAYCALFVYAASQTKAQADYSYFKTSEPGSSTRKMVESFTEPLKITAFFPDVSEVRSEVCVVGRPDARSRHRPARRADERHSPGRRARAGPLMPARAGGGLLCHGRIAPPGPALFGAAMARWRTAPTGACARCPTRPTSH